MNYVVLDLRRSGSGWKLNRISWRFDTSNDLVRYSRAGDKFHYRWPAHRCLRMIPALALTKLNLRVTEEAFIALCEGKHPVSGLKLGQRINTVRLTAGDEMKANRRIFYDFAIAPPKSVSVVALYQDDRILDLHNRAVKKAILELEKFAETRVRKGGLRRTSDRQPCGSDLPT